VPEVTSVSEHPTKTVKKPEDLNQAKNFSRGVIGLGDRRASNEQRVGSRNFLRRKASHHRLARFKTPRGPLPCLMADKTCTNAIGNNLCLGRFFR
jgi:hypothetical protein